MSAALFVFLTQGLFSASALEVRYEGKVYQLEGERVGGADYLPLGDLGFVLKGTTTHDPNTKRFTLSLGGHRFQFLPDNPFVQVDDSLLNLPLPPILQKNELLIPLPIVNRLLSSSLKRSFYWEPSKRVLTIGPKLHNISGIRIDSSPSLTQVTVETAKPLRFKFRKELPALIVDIEKGIFSPELVKDEPKGLVEGVTCQQLDNLARLRLSLTPEVGKVDTLSSEEPPKILLFLTKKEKRKPPKQRIELKKIVIDPGHGGRDPGALGAKRTKEKDVNLDVSKKLKKSLEKLGIEVILTRKDDSYVSLKDRTGIANREECDLFISIHCNASKRRQRGGCETYFLSVAKTDWARAVEARENAAIRFELPDPSFRNYDALSFILWDMAQNEYLNESSNLAECIQVELAKKLPIRDRGVQQAGFYVLAGAYMPAVLVEMAFVSNREEEKLLQKDWFKKRVVEGIYWGVKRFKESYERKLSQ